MLNGTLSLFDIRDVEAFCTDIANRQRQHDPHEHEDLIAYLIATCWEISTTHPQPWNTSFSGYVTPLLRLRIVDWHRKRHGRTTWTFHDHTHQRTQPTFISTDTELGTNLANRTMDTPEHRDTDLLRLLRTGPSTPPQGHPQHRPPLAQRAA